MSDTAKSLKCKDRMTRMCIVKDKTRALFHLCNLNETLLNFTIRMHIQFNFNEAHMKFADDKELEQFVEIAVKLKAMQRAGVPIPAEVREYFERNKDKSDVCYVLNDIIEH